MSQIVEHVMNVVKGLPKEDRKVLLEQMMTYMWVNEPLEMAMLNVGTGGEVAKTKKAAGAPGTWKKDGRWAKWVLGVDYEAEKKNAYAVDGLWANANDLAKGATGNRPDGSVALLGFKVDGQTLYVIAKRAMGQELRVAVRPAVGEFPGATGTFDVHQVENAHYVKKSHDFGEIMTGLRELGVPGAK